jgi:hypothetical protein
MMAVAALALAIGNAQADTEENRAAYAAGLMGMCP